MSQISVSDKTILGESIPGISEAKRLHRQESL